MNVHRTRQCLWLAAFTVGLCAVAVLASLWKLPLDGFDVPLARVDQTRSPDSAEPDILELSPADLMLVWNLDLRKPLFDPPRVAAVPLPPPPPPPPLAVRLMGTIVEPGSTAQAMLTTSRGQVEIKQVGDMVGESAANEGAKILTIEPGIVTVLYLGKEQKLLMEDPAVP